MSRGQSNIILAWRKHFGFTQQDIAQRAKISLSTWRNIESGRSSPRPDTLKQIAEVLEVSYQEFLEGPDKYLKGEIRKSTNPSPAIRVSDYLLMKKIREVTGTDEKITIAMALWYFSKLLPEEMIRVAGEFLLERFKSSSPD